MCCTRRLKAGTKLLPFTSRSKTGQKTLSVILIILILKCIPCRFCIFIKNIHWKYLLLKPLEWLLSCELKRCITCYHPGTKLESCLARCLPLNFTPSMPKLGRLMATSRRQQRLMKLPKTMIMLSGMYEAPHILSHEAII